MKKKILNFCLALIVVSCSTTSDTSNSQNPNTNTPPNTSGDWLIPINEVRDGGPGKDGIPSIDTPNFISAIEASFLNDNDLIVGIVKNGTARAYAHEILDWHEVLNDEIGGDYITINYCPLTGTAFGWESKANGSRTTFGVSGLLYNTNLILYDRNTGSNWSQLRLECVNGSLINDKPTLTNIVETDWKTWKTLYPDTEVLSLQTGFSRNYGQYPYGDYKTNHSRFVFAPSLINNALPNKERVYAIIDENKSKVYRFSNFNSGKVIKDTFNGKDYLIVGNGDLINAFELTGDNINLSFEYDFNSFEGAFFKDNDGNTWSVFGEVVDGPRTGDVLTSVRAVVSYWFAIAVFYPNPEIYSIP